jgi:uncharacterized protein (DUF58 family)
VHLVGPLLHVRSDPLGLFRRRTSWAGEEELLVRPRITALRSLNPGLINDLEGLPSEHPAASDLAFHALREYVAGDDLRHVHWRSSAKAGQLLVRQYVETRRSQATFVVDDDPSAYVDEEDFELAVSAAASLAVRALRDDFEVAVVCGNVFVSSASVDTVLDATCRFGLGGTDLRLASRRAAATGSSGSSLVAVLSGRLRPLPDLLLAGGEFPADAVRLLISVDSDGRSGLSTAPGFIPLSLSRLVDLPRLLAGTGVAA